MSESLLASAPQLPLEVARALARDRFGVDGTAAPLPSERDQNVRIDTADGRRFVLKIANAQEDRAFLDAQQVAMAAARAFTGELQRSLSGRPVEEVTAAGARHAVRLVRWVDGVPLGELGWRDPALLEQVGRLVAEVDAALAPIDHPALHRTFHWDLAQASQVLARAGELPAGDEARHSVATIAARYEADVRPRLETLPQQAVHHDANDYNVLVDLEGPGGRTAPRVSGLVDWGDMVWSHRVNDLAVAAAYAALGHDDPLQAVAAVVRGYHRILPLTDDEQRVVTTLVLARWGMSLVHAAWQMRARPDDPYLAISQAPIRQALPALLAVHPRLAWYTVRQACGLDPVPQHAHVVSWLSRQTAFASVVGRDLTAPDTVRPLDLSVGSPLVAGDAAANGPEPLGARVFARLRRAGEAGSDSDAYAVGAGGYLEPRVLYTSPAFQGRAPLAETRTVHLGIDLTLPAGAPLYAPLDGVVHGFEDAQAPLDYGPVLVLRHEADGAPFYTLYGHLSRESIAGRVPGTPVRKGERIGAIGDPSVNGGWWPHLHLQVITDMLDVPCNVNGSARPMDLAVWASICPDPNLLLRIPPASLPNPARDDVSLLESRRAHTGGNVRLSYAQPVHMVRGWRQYLYDASGRRYLDAYNNVPHVGHAHPRVVEAVQSQLAVLNTNTRYLQDAHEAYVEALLATFPPALSVCYLTASGSEATELALRLARARTGARDLLVLEGAYHGHTCTAIDISPYKHAGPGGSGAPDWVHATPLPDVYRGRYRSDTNHPGLAYAREVGAVLDRLQASGRAVCGYLAETCPSVGGQLLLPDGYLAEVYRLVRAAGGVCMADEVQTGLGRIGTHFWAFEAHGVLPDIVVLGKPLGNGFPMGAVVTTRAMADAFDNGMEYFSTFGGSTAACAAGLATLRVTQDEGLMAHARQVGDALLAQLRGLAARHPLIGDVRGSGLFLGVELVRDPVARTPAPEAAAAAVNRLRALGVLTGTDGPDHNVIKIRGPMPFDARNADMLCAALDRALAGLA